ncbi:MAG TPA: M28 family peptidase [Candidatus Acidoferrales bacterium]|nr:M28 family peptidase [Candidatus Acidoferrales bacterium]
MTKPRPRGRGSAAKGALGRHLALAALLLLAAGAWAQQQPRQAVDVIREADLKADLFFLAADEMAGRNTTSPEAHIAANYIAAEFMRLGLKPVGAPGSYFQDFDMVIGNLDPARTTLTAKMGGAEKSFQLGHDFLWTRQSLRPTTACGPLVFAGYGIDAPEYGYDDFSGADLKGKIAMVLDREPQANDPHSKFKGTWDTYHAYNWFKIEQVRKQGAVGLLMVPSAGQRRKMGVPSAPRNFQAGPQPEHAIAGDFWDLPIFIVRRDVADQLLAPSGKTIDAVQTQIDSSGNPASFEVPGVSACLTKSFTDLQVGKARNVVGLLEGSDPQLRQQAVVVSGHYDHVGVVSGRIYHGADDNASGTVGVMEIAKAFVEGNVHPRRSIVFIAYEAEEQGLLGSYYYVTHPAVPLSDTVLNLNMDMIGRDEVSANWPTPPDKNANMVNIVGTPYDGTLRQTIDSLNQQVGLRLDYKTDKVDPESWFARSDHFWFATLHIPMVLFNTGEHPDYHTENDTWTRINYPKMAKIIRLIFLTAADAADSNGRIAFTP